MTTLLAFDTATEQMGIGVSRGGRVWSREVAGGSQASATLLPAITALLAEAGTGLAQLDAIAFGRGPGAFTGLRTACAVAQGLACGASKPVLPVDTLLALAEDARGDATGFSVWALLDARMDEIYAAQYRHDAQAGWQVVTAPLLTTPESLNERWRTTPPAAVAGRALQAFGTRLEPGGAALFPEARPAAPALLRVAHAACLRGEAVDAALALPLYVRDKVAQTTLERDAARQAKQEAAA